LTGIADPTAQRKQAQSAFGGIAAIARSKNCGVLDPNRFGKVSRQCPRPIIVQGNPLAFAANKPKPPPFMSASLKAPRLFVAFLMAFVSSTLLAQEFKAGVGRADITPNGPIRLAGYASRDKPSTGVYQHIFSKALALQDSTGAVTLIIAADTIGAPRSFNDKLAARLQEELKIPRERFVFACSHSHSTPVVDGGLTDMYGLQGEDAKTVAAYAVFFMQQSVEAAKAALKDLETATLSFGRSEAFFAGNRRQFGLNGVGFGYNPNGLVDRDVPVLRVARADGSIKAVLFGYACHCTTLGPNYEVGPDWAGFAAQAIETTFPGSTALFITGCGADANPYPRGSMFYKNAHGLELAGAVSRALSEPMIPVTGSISAAFDRVDLPLGKLPDKSYYEAKLLEKPLPTKRYAQRFLDMLARGESLPQSYSAPVQVFRFGDAFTFIAMSGEVVADYSYRLKRELPGERLWNAGYCNDVFAYVPSMRILTEGGYEADANLIYYGLPTRFAPAIENTLVAKILELVKKTGGKIPENSKP
jgi:neutral ceramidase